LCAAYGPITLEESADEEYDVDVGGGFALVLQASILSLFSCQV